MQTTEAKVNTIYQSGFPKKVQRNKYNLKINERLKAARNRKGLSAARVISELKKQGVSIGHSTLQGYEADEASLNHRYPSLPVLMELVDFYGCSLDYLFGLSDKFKVPNTVKEIDLVDVLESRGKVTFKGKKLTEEKREKILAELDMILAEMV